MFDGEKCHSWPGHTILNQCGSVGVPSHHTIVSRLLIRKSAFYDHLNLQLNPWKQAQANLLHARLKRSSGKKCDWRFSCKEGPSWLGSIYVYLVPLCKCRWFNSKPICPKTSFKDIQLDRHKASSIPFCLELTMSTEAQIYLRGFIPPKAWDIYFLRCITSSSEKSTVPKQMATYAWFQDCNGRLGCGHGRTRPSLKHLHPREAHINSCDLIALLQ